MAFRSRKVCYWHAVRNSAILGAISGISHLIVVKDLSLQNLYTGLLTALLVFFIEIRHAFVGLNNRRLNVYHQKPFFLSSAGG